MTALALPPLAEKTRIVAEVERRLSVVEELEAVVSANLQGATSLRQAVLEKAFAGGLIQHEGVMHQEGLMHQAPIWHRNYWDVIVRDEKALANIRAYIRNNPANYGGS